MLDLIKILELMLKVPEFSGIFVLIFIAACVGCVTLALKLKALKQEGDMKAYVTSVTTEMQKKIEEAHHQSYVNLENKMLKSIDEGFQKAVRLFLKVNKRD